MPRLSRFVRVVDGQDPASDSKVSALLVRLLGAEIESVGPAPLPMADLYTHAVVISFPETEQKIVEGSSVEDVRSKVPGLVEGQHRIESVGAGRYLVTAVA